MYDTLLDGLLRYTEAHGIHDDHLRLRRTVRVLDGDALDVCMDEELRVPVDAEVLACALREPLPYRTRVVVCQAVVGHDLPVEHNGIAWHVRQVCRDGHTVVYLHELVEVEEAHPVVLTCILVVETLVSLALQADKGDGDDEAPVYIVLEHVTEPLLSLSVVVVDVDACHAHRLVVLHPLPRVEVLTSADSTDGHRRLRGVPQVHVRLQPLHLLVLVVLRP